MEKKINSKNFLSKSINLLPEEKEVEFWQKLIKVLKRIAFFIFFAFLLATLLIFSYSWRLSSYDTSLEKRVAQAKMKINSLREEEETYRALVQKIRAAGEILNSQGTIIQFLIEVDSLMPSGVLPLSLEIDQTGQIRVTLPSLSLEQIETLNQNLKKGISEGKIAKAKIGGISKTEEGQYKIDVDFQLKR